jgi:nitroimidazol reductase NimA-like FMN-containing flavoprotein (pyridoxamine 5'-phosphate oxidase superfamily)
MSRADDRRMVELDEAECRELLGTQAIGRIAVVSLAGPIDVLPVNYVVHDGAILFRTHPSLTLHQVLGGPVTFEVDDVDWAHHTGWSVLVHGSATMARPVPDDDDPFDGGEPWAPGSHPLVVRIDPREMHGRRIELVQEQLDPRGYL